MRILLCMCALVLANCTAWSQTNKIVVDKENNAPITQVDIYTLEGVLLTQSDSLGKIVLSDTLKGMIYLEKAGYKTLYFDLSHAHGSTIWMTRHSQVLEEVAIVWQSAFLGLPTFANIDARSVDQLNAIPHTNLMQSLSEIPGVYTSNTGPGISKPVIRGLQGNRILTLFNGYKLEGQQWGGDHGLGITELGVQSVSVVKGPAALLYGADALGGVLMIQDNFRLYDKPLMGAISTQFETNTMGTTTNAHLNYRVAKKWMLQVGGRFTSHADYKIAKDAFVKNSRFLEYNAKAGIGYFGEKWSSKVQILMTSNQIGLPGHTHDADPNVSSFLTTVLERNKILPVQYNQQWFGIWNTQWKISSKDELTLTTGYTRQYLLEHDHKHTVPSLGMVTQNIPLQLLYNHKQKRSIWTFGMQGLWNQIRNNLDAEETLIPNAQQLDGGLVAKVQFDRLKWKTEVGVRGDVRHLATNDFSKSYAGGNVGWNNTFQFRTRKSLKVGLNSGFRIPHLSELLANGAHHGTFRYEVGDRNLKPEKAIQLDLSYDRLGDHFSFILNPYVGALNDFIYVLPTGNTVGGMPEFKYAQVDWAWQYGADLGVHLHPHFAHFLHLESTISYLNYVSKLKAFSLIPQPRWSTTIKVEPKMRGKAVIEHVYAQFVYHMPQRNTVTYETPTADFGVFNVGMDAVFGKDKNWKIQLAVRNLTNKQYIDHLSRLKPLGLSNPGRNIMIKLIYNL